MPVNQDKVNDRDTLKLVHFNLALLNHGILIIFYIKNIWEYANKTEYINSLINKIIFWKKIKIRGDNYMCKLLHMQTEMLL